MSSHRHLAPEHHEGNARCPCTPPEHDPEHKARSAFLGSGRRSTPSTGRMIVLPSLALGEHRADATGAWVYEALVLPRPLLSLLFLVARHKRIILDVETPRYTLRMVSAHGLARLDFVLHFWFSFLLGFGGRREGAYYTGAGIAPWGFVCFSPVGARGGLDWIAHHYTLFLLLLLFLLSLSSAGGHAGAEGPGGGFPLGPLHPFFRSL
ncbi:hypothetical protein B0T11DRAFT_83837 [Plectosphaerella cucumerina]|jgi:hypothetical protein|uniref:Uncharacterized protein n=1 Tax=Plectosphaerella cucumerina TaxID=40658 RepID=A0A8K0X3P4_9PEZI|nr:hypothetical protein B0T11DRAFT_83837 [Plectosphaerella cucumerina]